MRDKHINVERGNWTMTRKKVKSSKDIKVCLVGSSGGHLMHLYMLKPFWEKIERFWVTFDKEDAKSLLETRRYILAITQQTDL